MISSLPLGGPSDCADDHPGTNDRHLWLHRCSCPGDGVAGDLAESSLGTYSMGSWPGRLPPLILGELRTLNTVPCKWSIFFELSGKDCRLKTPATAIGSRWIGPGRCMANLTLTFDLVWPNSWPRNDLESQQGQRRCSNKWLEVFCHSTHAARETRSFRLGSCWNYLHHQRPWLKYALHVNSMKLVILLPLLYWSIHTKDESKRGTAFAFIFGVNWLWRCGVTASFGVFFHETKCNGMTSFMEFMVVHMNWVFVYIRTAQCDVTPSRQKRSKMVQGWITSLQKDTKQCCDVIMKLDPNKALLHFLAKGLVHLFALVANVEKIS